MSVPIFVDRLSKRFGRVLAVEEVSLEVRAGEVVGLLGPNGAGKTTALRVLAGLLQPSSGRALLEGVDVTKDPLAARRKLGFLTATTGLYERLTPRELLWTFGALHGLSPEALEGRIQTLSEAMDLKGLLDRRCGALSSGQKQRVSIARAVVHDPSAFVLDEPTAMLDPLAAKSVLDFVHRVRKEGKAVLFSTHRMEEAEYLCDRLYFLRRGKVVAQGTPRELREQSGQSTLTGAFLHHADERRAER